jgi:hypothetical protein
MWDAAEQLVIEEQEDLIRILQSRLHPIIRGAVN